MLCGMVWCDMMWCGMIRNEMIFLICGVDCTAHVPVFVHMYVSNGISLQSEFYYFMYYFHFYETAYFITQYTILKRY